MGFNNSGDEYVQSNEWPTWGAMNLVIVGLDSV